MEMTGEEAMSKLFHPKVVEHVKKVAREAAERVEKRTSKDSTNAD
jgi:hypothetical protein